MLKTQKLVHEFMVKMGLPLPNEAGPSIEGLKTLKFDLLRKLVREEAQEFDDWFVALRDQLVRDPEDALWPWAQVLDACADIIVVVHNTTNAMGIDLEPIFDEVHRTNMLKADGPKNADGKQLKPEGWEEPRVLDLLRAQIASQRVYQTIEVPRTFFVIVKHEFDSMENKNPWRDEIVAIADDQLDAARTIQALQLGAKTSRGWDGNTYPHWSYQEVPDARTFLARLPTPPPPVPSESDEGLPPLKFQIGDRITVHLNDEQGRVGGVVTEVRRCQPYPPGFGPTHGVMVSAVLDCNVVTGLMPESAFEFEPKVHVGVDLSVEPSKVVVAEVEVEGGKVLRVTKVSDETRQGVHHEVGDRVFCMFNEAFGEEGVVGRVTKDTNEQWVDVRLDSGKHTGLMPSCMFKKPAGG